MAENIDSLVLEHLRAIRADIADLKREVAGNSLQIAAMGQQLAGLTTAVYSSKGDVEALKVRLERLERRMEIVDEH